MKIGEFFKTPEFRAINFFSTIILIIVISIWAVQVTGYKQRLLEINKPQLENCFYLDCETNIFGNLNCVPREMTNRTGIGGFILDENFILPNQDPTGIGK
jgi:hypothetical protein